MKRKILVVDTEHLRREPYEAVKAEVLLAARSCSEAELARAFAQLARLEKQQFIANHERIALEQILQQYAN